MPTKPRPIPTDRGAQAPRRDPRQHDRLAEVGALMSATGPGPRSARTTATTARPGPTCPTSSPGARRIAGARTASPAGPTATSSSSSPRPSGTAVDKILKERLFGLAGPEGNHGEDVKEYYYYLDATPSHSYLRFLYKYPQAEYPLRASSSSRAPGGGPTEPEYELIDTGIFDEDRYFDIEVEYAKVTMEDVAIRIRATNRGSRPRPVAPDPAPLVPQHLGLGPRNPSSRRRSTSGRRGEDLPGPDHRRLDGRDPGHRARRLPDRRPDVLRAHSAATPLFTNNDTNFRKVYGPGARSIATPYVKDAFHRHGSSTARTAPTPTGSAPSRPSITTSTPSGPARPSPSGSA